MDNSHCYRGGRAVPAGRDAVSAANGAIQLRDRRRRRVSFYRTTTTITSMAPPKMPQERPQLRAERGAEGWWLSPSPRQLSWVPAVLFPC